ncbi:MAG: cytidylate kinase family protein [Nanoarchaeota archaeon]
MIITIAGDIGAGKSTVAGILSRELGFKNYSCGRFQRKIANDRGVPILVLAEIAKTDPTVDEATDRWQVEIGKKEDNFVMEGRISFHFIPDSYKVYLAVRPEEGGKRVFKSKRPDEQANTTLQLTMENNRTRREAELYRYKTTYNLDPTDKRNYDLVIDTTDIPATEVARRIIEGMRKHPHRT